MTYSPEMEAHLKELDAFRERSGRGPDMQVPLDTPEITFLDLTKEPEPVEWMADRWVAKKDIILLGGRAGSGKSTTAVDLAITMSGARNGESDGYWLGNKISETPVMYLDEEAGDAEIVRQFRRQGAVRYENLWVASMQRLRLSDPESMKKIENAIREKQPGLLILDTASHFFLGVDENNANEVTRAFLPLFYLRDTFGVSVLLIHHIRKPPQNADHIDVLDSVRGSTAFTTQPSVVWGAVPNHTGDFIDLLSSKRRGGGRKESMRLKYYQRDDGQVRLESIGEPEQVESSLDACSRLIMEYLSDGKIVRSSDLISHCENHGFPTRTAERTKSHLKAVEAIVSPSHGIYRSNHSGISAKGFDF
jgi:hypothetical protein